MPSPFPGMDPYLEDPWLWPDLHLTLIVTIRAAIAQQLPLRYVILADRYVWVENQESEPRTQLWVPDASIVDTHQEQTKTSTSTIAAPIQILLPALTEKGSPYLKIVDRQQRRLVTVLELLSPTNKKAGKNRDAYLMKSAEYLASGVNFVEIDLLRTGERPGWMASLPTDYYLLVSRAVDRPRAGIWPFSVREPMPRFAVPLADGDETEINVALGDCLTQAYDNSTYSRELDYARPPNPPLTEPDATWARELLARRFSSSTTQGTPS